MNDSIPVELTPIKYLKGDGNISKRNLLQFDSGQSPVQLKVVHDKNNYFDNKALKVFYDDLYIGHIRKSYIDEDLTGMINNLCFDNNQLKKVKLICSNSAYILSLDDNQIKTIDLDLSFLDEDFKYEVDDGESGMHFQLTLEEANNLLYEENTDDIELNFSNDDSKYEVDERGTGMNSYQPTNEQLKIINAVKNLEAPLLKVLAFAGTGKTTTLVDAARSIDGRKLYLAFNKSIQVEAEEKFSGLNTVVKTTHALAFGYIVRERGYKLKHAYNPQEILRHYDIDSKHYWRAKKAKEYFEKFCNGAEDNFSAYEEDGKEALKALDLAERLFNDMIDKNIDITHSGYLKLFEMELKRGNIKITQYRLIMLDEAQDTNDVTLSIFYLLNAQQRLVVGDRHQQIYSFRGSVNAMSKIKSKSFTLTNSFRFTESIGEVATEFLSKFRLETLILVGRGREKEKSINDTTAYITRTNARLIQIFAENMMEKQYIKPIRSPDAIFGLAINMDRLKHNELELIDREFYYLKGFMDDYKKLRRSKREEVKDVFGFIQSTIHDEDDEHIRTIKLLEKYEDIEGIYEYALDCYNKSDKALLYATTAHTSKGLEWDHVVIENDFPGWYTIAKWYQKCYKKSPVYVLNPFQFFVENVDNNKISEGCDAQTYIDELNLYYVAITRGKYTVQDHTEFSILPDKESEYDREVIKAYPKDNNKDKDDSDDYFIPF